MKEFKVSPFIHIMNIILIISILGLCVIKIHLWNISSSDLPNISISEEEFLTESEDFFVTTDISTIENYHDDGMLTVVFIGDTSLHAYGDETGVCELTEKYIYEALTSQSEDSKCFFPADTKLRFYNCSFDGSSMTTEHNGYDGTYGNDGYCFYYLSMCILNKVFILPKQGLETGDIVTDTYTDTISTLESIDFNSVDVIVLSYGVQDYLKSHNVIPESDSEEQAYTQNPLIFTDVLRQGIAWINLAYPQIQFIVMSPNYCLYDDENGNLIGCDKKRNNVNANMADYTVCEKIAATSLGVTFLDNYWGLPITEKNALNNLVDDYAYPNEACRDLIAKKLSSTILTKLYYKSTN